MRLLIKGNLPYIDSIKFAAKYCGDLVLSYQPNQCYDTFEKYKPSLVIYDLSTKELDDCIKDYNVPYFQSKESSICADIRYSGVNNVPIFKTPILLLNDKNINTSEIHSFLISEKIKHRTVGKDWNDIYNIGTGFPIEIIKNMIYNSGLLLVNNFSYNQNLYNYMLSLGLVLCNKNNETKDLEENVLFYDSLDDIKYHFNMFYKNPQIKYPIVNKALKFVREHTSLHEYKRILSLFNMNTRIVSMKIEEYLTNTCQKE